MDKARQQANCVFALIFLDLDRFRLVNDSLGHLVGDGLLRRVANQLRRELRPHDTVARVGGDEFAVLLENVATPAEALRLAKSLREQLRRPVVVDGHQIHVTASLGVVLGPGGYDRPEEVLQNAAIAMKDFSAFSVQNQQALEAEKQVAGYPLTGNYIFYTELEQRTQRLILLTANVMDFYILYNKTTYCYGRDEKNFLFSRIDFIQKMLQRLLDAPYVVDTSASNADTARLHDKRAFFEEQVNKLQAFITKSLPALKH